MKSITMSILKELNLEESVLYSYIDRFKQQLVESNKQPENYMITDITRDAAGALHIQYQPKPYTRIRRITGYLVSDIDRWNDGKYAELMDRVCHSN